MEWGLSQKLTREQAEILVCAAQNGSLTIFRTNAGDFVSAGTVDFITADPSVQARYLAVFMDMLAWGDMFEHPVAVDNPDYYVLSKRALPGATALQNSEEGKAIFEALKNKGYGKSFSRLETVGEKTRP